LCSYDLQQCDTTARTPLEELTALPRPPGRILRRGQEGKREGKGKWREMKSEGDRKGKETEVKGKEGKERRRGQRGGREEEKKGKGKKEKRKGEGKGRNFVQLIP